MGWINRQQFYRIESSLLILQGERSFTHHRLGSLQHRLHGQRQRGAEWRIKE